MTDRVRTSISKVSVTLGLIITIVTLIAGGVRIVDLTSQTASTVGDTEQPHRGRACRAHHSGRNPQGRDRGRARG